MNPEHDAIADHRLVVTAGHVDHGKSTLARALTGQEPDRLAEERRRGLSIELGFVWTTLVGSPPITLALVDVPGHERFIPTMLTGAGAAPAALLVVAADDGWSVQSSEHRDLLDLLGVLGVVTVISKVDTVSPSRVATVVAEVTDALAGTSLAPAPVLAVDAVTGSGLQRLRQVLQQRLLSIPPPADRDRPRLWVDRVFTVHGAGTVVTGTLVDGSLTVGDEVLLLPAGGTVRLRRLQSLGAEVMHAGPGTRVAANLVGVAHTEVGRGSVLVGGGPWRTASRIEAWVRVLPGQRLDRPGTWACSVGTASSRCQVAPLTGPVDGGEEGAVRIQLTNALPVVSGDRLVLRELGQRQSVAGGYVVDPDPPMRVRGSARRQARSQLLAELASATAPEQRLAGLVRLAGGVRDDGSARAAAGVNGETAAPANLIQVGPALVSDERLAAVTRQIVTALREHGPGIHDRETVVAIAVAADLSPTVAKALPELLVDTGVLVRRPQGYALPDQADAASRDLLARAALVVAALAAEPFAPPDLDELLRQHGMDARERAALLSSGAVVRCGRVTFAGSAVDAAIVQLRLLSQQVGPFTTSQARACLGTTRRYVIPLLEHFDRTGVTRFDGQRRELRESGVQPVREGPT